MGDFDVTGNIRTIEKLKVELLAGVSELYSNMLKPAAGSDAASERTEIMADIVILSYLLAGRIGISPSALTNKVAARLRVGVMDDQSPMRADLQAILGHMDRSGKDRGGDK